MNRETAIPSKLSGCWKALPGRLLCLGLAALVLGCSQGPRPEVTGISRFVLFNELAGDYRFTLDTGGGGTQPIHSDVTWGVNCDVSVPGSPSMYLARKDHVEVARREPDTITLLALGPEPESSPRATVVAMLDDYHFAASWCPVTFEAVDGDPAAGTFSAEPCDVQTDFGDKGRLEFAVFHVKNCTTEPSE
ncbi:hypothetical protein [Sorangium sp. So ce1024]|uniref:hypothetical protein n=1 Tax=unclassified Sorangium TaxID=2621164 RepID=UPI003F09FDC6